MTAGETHSALDDCLGANENHVDSLHDVRDGTVEHDVARDPSGGEDLVCAHAAARECVVEVDTKPAVGHSPKASRPSL